MALKDELDTIWDNALKDSPCRCGNDDNWEQDITGVIFCSSCKEDITVLLTPTLSREKKRIHSK